MAEWEVAFDADSHSADAIQRAAYKFADRFSVEVIRDGACFRCRLWFVGEADELALAAFRTEVLDQVLRERIRGETAEVRNLVLALAFSKTGLSDE